MRLTNNYNLPDAIIRAIENDPYSKGDSDFSVTELLKPSRQRALQKVHNDELVEDASDRVWALVGQALHAILERANMRGDSERRLSITIDGKTVSGAMDLYHEGTLTDYKTTSVWKIIYGGAAEWEEQLNLYAAILRANNFEVKELEVIALLRDWSKRDLVRLKKNYPKAQVIKVPLQIWDSETATKFLRQRIRSHLDAEKRLPLCTYSERWASPKTFGSRCESYCSVSKFCDQLKDHQEE